MTEEEEENTDNDRTLADLKRKREASTSQEAARFPGGELFPNHPKKPRATAWKRKATTSTSDDYNNEQLR